LKTTKAARGNAPRRVCEPGCSIPGADHLYCLGDFIGRREKRCLEAADFITGNAVKEVIEPEGRAFEFAEQFAFHVSYSFR